MPAYRLTPAGNHHVLNSVAAGRRQAGRAIAWQVGATLLVALACLWKGLHWSAAALVGGGAVVLALALARCPKCGTGKRIRTISIQAVRTGKRDPWRLRRN